jgi:hypothetical protein
MPKSLREEMDTIAEMAVAKTAEAESSFQTLHLVMPDDSLVVALLDVGPGVNIALACRMMVYEQEPVMAVLQTEGWAVHTTPDEKDPDRRAVLEGRKKPSDLPIEKRDESLILYGESAAGESVHRMWAIHTRAGKRTLEAMPEAMHVDSRFKPLFLVEDMERLLEREIANPTLEPELTRQIINKLGVPEPEERHRIVRKIVGEMLASAKPVHVPSRDARRN